MNIFISSIIGVIISIASSVYGTQSGNSEVVDEPLNNETDRIIDNADGINRLQSSNNATSSCLVNGNSSLLTNNENPNDQFQVDQSEMDGSMPHDSSNSSAGDGDEIQQSDGRGILSVISAKLHNLFARLNRIEEIRNSRQGTTSRHHSDGSIFGPHHSTINGNGSVERDTSRELYGRDEDTRSEMPIGWVLLGDFWFGIAHALGESEELDYNSHVAPTNPRAGDGENEDHASVAIDPSSNRIPAHEERSGCGVLNNSTELWTVFKSQLGRFASELYARMRGNSSTGDRSIRESDVLEVPHPGRPQVIISYNVTSAPEQEVNAILTYVARTNDDFYVYYISDVAVLPFLVIDRERMLDLDECYLVILKETYAGNNQWNIYYILGEHSDEDIRSTAAEYALMLHDRLKVFNTSFVYRKYETLPLKNFLANITRHLSKKDETSMYLIKREGLDILTKKVPLNENFYKTNTCVVIIVSKVIGDSKITQACGSEVDSAVQDRTAKLTNLVSVRYSSGHIQSTTDFSTIIVELGNNVTSEEDVDREGLPEMFIFIDTEIKDSLVFIPEKIDYLNTTACYILDSKNYSGVFFWIGSAAPLCAQTTGIEKLENYLNMELKRPHTHVTIIQQGKETIDFLLNFPEWYI